MKRWRSSRSTAAPSCSTRRRENSKHRSDEQAKKDAEKYKYRVYVSDEQKEQIEQRNREQEFKRKRELEE